MAEERPEVAYDSRLSAKGGHEGALGHALYQPVRLDTDRPRTRRHTVPRRTGLLTPAVTTPGGRHRFRWSEVEEQMHAAQQPDDRED